MKNFISVKKSGTDKSDAEDDSPTCSFPTENRRREIVDLRRLLRDKISKHEIFYSFEVVSRKQSDTCYQRFVQKNNLGQL